MRVVELAVVAGAPAAGATVGTVAWPPDTLLTSLRRGTEVIVPTGSTRLEVDDELIVLTTPDSVEDVRTLVAMPGSIESGREEPV